MYFIICRVHLIDYGFIKTNFWMSFWCIYTVFTRSWCWPVMFWMLRRELIQLTLSFEKLCFSPHQCKLLIFHQIHCFECKISSLCDLCRCILFGGMIDSTFVLCMFVWLYNMEGRQSQKYEECVRTDPERLKFWLSQHPVFVHVTMSILSIYFVCVDTTDVTPSVITSYQLSSLECVNVLMCYDDAFEHVSWLTHIWLRYLLWVN